jgi:predicted dienelactone hydrolase
MRRAFAVTVLVLVALPLFAQQAEPYKKSAGPFAVETVLYDWVDLTRNREVPVKIYFPKTGDGLPAEALAKAGPFPVIIFSHGLGGSREGYEYLGRHWASHGYVSVHLDHKGSDAEVWKADPQDPMKGMRESIADPRNALSRAFDVRFAIDRMAKLNREDSPFKGRLDLDHVGLAGHSFGAWTTLAVAGQTAAALERGKLKLADARVKAAIAMSSPVTPNAKRSDAYAGIKIPILHMTGTKDMVPILMPDAADRRIPFDRITGADQYLVTFEGGDHMIFPGHKRVMGGGEKDPVFHDLIRQTSTAFWDAYLKNDAKARTWLADGGFEAVLGKDGKFEKKPAAP